MKKIINISLILMLFLSSICLIGCDDDFSVYVFTSSGGYVYVQEKEEDVLFKEKYVSNKKITLTLTAKAEGDANFLHWLKNDEIYSSEDTIKLSFTKETVVKAIFTSSKTFTITYKDEQGNYIAKENLVENSVISMAPKVKQKAGYNATYYYNNDIIENGKEFKYSQDITAVLQYERIYFDVSVPTSSFYKLRLESGYSWKVEFGKDVKFTLSIETDHPYAVVKSNGKILTPDIDDIYTISNIREEQTIIVTLYDEKPVTDESETEYFKVSFSAKSDLDYVSLELLADYNTQNGGYVVEKNTSFDFTIKKGKIYKDYFIRVLVNNEELELANERYSIKNIKEDKIVKVLLIKTMNFTFNYGIVGGVEFEMAVIDGNYLPYYYGSIDYSYSDIVDEGSVEIEGSDNVNLYNSKTNIVEKTFIEYLREINDVDLNMTYNYRISSITLHNASTNTTVENWCTANYYQLIAERISSLNFCKNSFDLDNLEDITFTIIWEKY